MKKTRIAAAASPLAMLLLLTGCFPSGTVYSVLNREAEEGDRLPASVDGLDVNLDADSARFAGEHDGTRVWLALQPEERAVCVVVLPPDEGAFVGCGGDGGGVGAGGPTGTYTVIPDGAFAPEGAIELSENVYYSED